MDEQRNSLMRKATGYDEYSNYKMKRPRRVLLQGEEKYIRGTDRNLSVTNEIMFFSQENIRRGPMPGTTITSGPKTKRQEKKTIHIEDKKKMRIKNGKQLDRTSTGDHHRVRSNEEEDVTHRRQRLKASFLNIRI